MSTFASEIPSRCVFLDLETTQSGKILKIGAYWKDRVFYREGKFHPREALLALDKEMAGAECLAGHNVMEHDWKVLHDAAPDLKIVNIPVLDTLLISPICFPENPYHHLVKDYKIVSESRNNPVEDSRLSEQLLGDEFSVLSGILANDPVYFNALRFLIAHELSGDIRQVYGFQWLFSAVSGFEERPSDTEGLEAIRKTVEPFCCHEGLRQVLNSIAQPDARWALAFAMSWLRVAGHDSILPAWVRIRHPYVLRFLAMLREIPCSDSECSYCHETHNPEAQLKNFFGFDAFRPTPAAPDGSSLQRQIIAAGMRNHSLLGILPTGGGKSICFQLPALVRGFRRGQLTIVISPLQALMKDQVDGLIRRTGLANVAALNGLLTSPERGQVIRDVSSGKISILYISPEQLRTSGLKKAILMREIGCWVFDEVHCLSKWGHDFRTDYLYAGRFISELAKEQNCPIPCIQCFTATAKPDVIDEILNYFKKEHNLDLEKYEGGVNRDNLSFLVQIITSYGKLQRIHELLEDRFGGVNHLNDGSAVVFRATRASTEETADFLTKQGWSVHHFHAGMTVPEKKRIQDDFLAGNIQVICATNAFGMGIDKDDVRIVIHGDIPSSLENYLQEAGRAGRDRKPAECILLYDENDCEQQFKLGSMSELSRRDIAQILRGLRKASSKNRDQNGSVVVTSGELLLDEDVDTSFDVNSVNAETKVRTAISWLEQAGFVERNENRTNVIQAKLLVKDLREAEQKIAELDLSQLEKSLWLAIIRTLLESDGPSALAVDQVAGLPEFATYHQAEVVQAGVVCEANPNEHKYRADFDISAISKKIFKILEAMMTSGIMIKATMLSAYLRYKIADHSRIRFQHVSEVEDELIKLLSQKVPDPEGWMPLNLQLTNDEMQDHTAESSQERVRKLLKCLGDDFQGSSVGRGFDIKFTVHGSCQIRINCSWKKIATVAGLRHQVAAKILEVLYAKIPNDTSAKSDLLVEFSLEDLQAALQADLSLRSAISNPIVAIERGLMFLHDLNIITLQKGLAIFRSAMTIRVLPESTKQPYTNDNYAPLRLHYAERVFQVHVMNLYAQQGAQKISAALELVFAYFMLAKEAFISRFFGENQKMLDQATTTKSYRSIVDNLGNRDQQRIVVQPKERCTLILAGPGSGKTRTVVHRCAFLLRVTRVRPRSILVCCYNHKAAIELRKRLFSLVGNDACGVTIQTYHALSLRLLGVSCKSLDAKGETNIDFGSYIRDATKILLGENPVPGLEPDEARDHLLAGFEHILVDEYQDIDEDQYALISAISGRTINDDPDRKLSILAVGDDDQSIYRFRGANVNFIRRFQADYNASVAYLLENYRSSKAIIDAANTLIDHNTDRMKIDREIRIDRGRLPLPYGGSFGETDAVGHGLVGIFSPPNIFSQAADVVAEIQRLQSLGIDLETDIAVLSRHRADLVSIREAAEGAGIPVRWSYDKGKTPPLSRVREIAEFLSTLTSLPIEPLQASELRHRLIPDSGVNPWIQICSDLLSAWETETGDTPLPPDQCVSFAYEFLAQLKREESVGRGVPLMTIHAAKGMEFNHVLVCNNHPHGCKPEDWEEERRLLYVGMTRARQTLSLFMRSDLVHPFRNELLGQPFYKRPTQAVDSPAGYRPKKYTLLGLEDFFINFAGLSTPDEDIHESLHSLKYGDHLTITTNDNRLSLITPGGHLVGKLSKKASDDWRYKLDTIIDVRITSIVERRKTDNIDPEYPTALRCDKWLIPLCEITALSIDSSDGTNVADSHR